MIWILLKGIAPEMPSKISNHFVKSEQQKESEKKLRISRNWQLNSIMQEVVPSFICIKTTKTYWLGVSELNDKIFSLFLSWAYSMTRHRETCHKYMCAKINWNPGKKDHVCHRRNHRTFEVKFRLYIMKEQRKRMKYIAAKDSIQIEEKERMQEGQKARKRTGERMERK